MRFIVCNISSDKTNLENKGIETVFELSKYSKDGILSLHGMGTGSIPKLLAPFKKHNLSFKEDYI